MVATGSQTLAGQLPPGIHEYQIDLSVEPASEAGHRPGPLGSERLIRPGLLPPYSDCRWLCLPVVSEHQPAVNSERVNVVLGDTAVGKGPSPVQRRRMGSLSHWDLA